MQEGWGNYELLSPCPGYSHKTARAYQLLNIGIHPDIFRIHPAIMRIPSTNILRIPPDIPGTPTPTLMIPPAILRILLAIPGFLRLF
jgi:hypothetical protein